MKDIVRLAVCLFLATIGAGLAHANDLFAEYAQQALDDIETIRTNYPRYEGSEGEQKTLAFIRARLERAGVSYRHFDFSESTVSHSFSSCIEVTLPGARRDTLIIATPLNHLAGSSAEFDGSINIAIALNLIAYLGSSTPPITLKFLFLGAEFGDSSHYPMGSKLFLADFKPDYRAMVVYLNMMRRPRRLHIRSGGLRVVAPYWLVNHCTEALELTDIFFLARGNENQIFRMGLTSERTIMESFLASGYPAVSLEGDYEPATGADQDWIASFLRFLDTLIEGFWQGIPESWDRHYLFFQARGFYLIISERVYITVFLVILSLAAVYSLAFSARMKKYLRTLGRGLWTIPILCALAFGILLLASLALEAVMWIRNFPSLWEHLPLPFLALKCSLCGFLLTLLLPLLRRLPFSKNGSFYSACALLLLVIDVLLLAAVNVSFSYYLLWALLFALFFAIAPWPKLKLLFFLASPYWIVKTIVELFAIGQTDFCEVVLLSRLWGNLLLAAIVLPFALMGIRLSFLFRSPGRMRRGSYLLAAMLGLFSVVIGGGFILYDPYSEIHPQPVLISATIIPEQGLDQVLLESTAPLGKGEFRNAAERVGFETQARSYLIPLPSGAQYVTIAKESRSFLNRENVALEIDSREQPFAVKFTLHSGQEFVLFDANFPFSRHETGKEYEILIGPNPPDPLPVELTLPRGRAFECRLSIEYLDPLMDIELAERAVDMSRRLMVYRHFEFQT